MSRNTRLLLRMGCFSAVLVAALSATGTTQHVSPRLPRGRVEAVPVAPANGTSAAPFSGVLLGQWTYRSFVNDPDVSKPFNDIEFGAGVLTVTSITDGSFRGRLSFGPDAQLGLKGSITYGNPPVLRFQGVGDTPGAKDWVYDYQGYLVLEWPNGVDQRPAIVGSVIRTQPHSNGQAKAGVVASFVAVKQDPAAAPSTKVASAAVRAALATPPAPPSSRRVPPNSFFRPPPATNALTQAPKLTDADVARAKNRRAAVLAATKELAPYEKNEIRSKNGRLDADLVVDYTDGAIGTDKVHLRMYNGKLVGPTLRAKAGDTLYITLKNQLPAENDPGHMNEHHGWNTTNLHVHGLHVAPQGTPAAESDNVLLELGPGKEQKYAIKIPKDHVAGTFWYHAHKHGSTSAQVASGMAGALIIERDDDVTNLDCVPEVKAAKEQVLVFQQVPYLMKDGRGVIELGTADDLNKMFGPGSWHAPGTTRYTTVNGQQLPVLTLAPGEVQRWRMVHSGFREFLKLRLAADGTGTGPAPAPVLFNEIAVDGLPLGKINTVESVELYPGYRSDVLVKAPATPGTYVLIDETAPAANSLLGTPKPLSYVAKVVVTGAAHDMPLPRAEQLAKHRLPSLDPNTPVGQQAYYGITSQGFMISDQEVPAGEELPGREFDPAKARVLTLGKVDKWVVGTRNFTAPSGPTHPFHIHVNPFEIISIKDTTGRETLTGGPVWRDTVAMPPGYTITFLTKYQDFTGDFVQHCHILDHEDQGMMELVRIAPAGGAGAGARRPEAGTVPGMAWQLPGADGTPRRGADFLGRPTVLVFSKGFGCPHCSEQIDVFASQAKAFADRSANLVFVTSEAGGGPKAAGGSANSLVLLADPKHDVFRGYGCYTGEPLHGTLVLDAKGEVRWRMAGSTPWTDVASVLREVDRLSPK